jgi:hypothetical protein
MSFEEYPEAFFGGATSAATRSRSSLMTSGPAWPNSKRVAGALALLMATTTGATLAVDVGRAWRKC